MAAIKYWVWLSALRMRPRAKQLLLEHFHDDPERLYYAEPRQLKGIEGIKQGDIERMGIRELDTAMAILERCEMQHIDIVTLQDAMYPQRLKNIYDPPVVLYVKGRLPVIDEEAAIAIVGTRDATPYGVKMARKFGHDIAQCGGLVISGLTRGIDRNSAEGALYGGSRVVGILGTSHDEARGGIFDDVAAYGALVSEYPPGQPTVKDNFRYRNRITAGLSVGVLVVEAPVKSGALLFAGEALEQGKEIFAVPGNADQPNCVGTNQLLKDGAKPVTEAWDILCEYKDLYRGKLHLASEDLMKITSDAPDSLEEKYADFVQVRVPTAKKVIDKPNPVEYIDLEKRLEGLNEAQLKIVAAMQSEPTYIDDLITATGLDAPTVLSELTMLQIEGIVEQEPGKRFTLNIIRG